MLGDLIESIVSFQLTTAIPGKGSTKNFIKTMEISSLLNTDFGN